MAVRTGLHDPEGPAERGELAGPLKKPARPGGTGTAHSMAHDAPIMHLAGQSYKRGPRYKSQGASEIGRRIAKSHHAARDRRVTRSGSAPKMGNSGYQYG